MLKKVFASAVFGVEASTITVEVNVDKGVGYHLVGLPDNAIKESNYRIAAALQNNGFRIPGKKITINMAPADLRKRLMLSRSASAGSCDCSAMPSACCAK